MVQKFPIWFLTVSLIVLISACAASDGAGSDPAEPAVVAIGEAEAGTTVNLAAGDQLVVSLPANPGTGYTWELQPAPDEAILKLAAEPQFAAQDTNQVGAPGLLTFTFDAISAGETMLSLVYHRTWETGVAPLETYEVMVRVK
jgi:inhibitor of cysteine peptidase